MCCTEGLWDRSELSWVFFFFFFFKFCMGVSFASMPCTTGVPGAHGGTQYAWYPQRHIVYLAPPEAHSMPGAQGDKRCQHPETGAAKGPELPCGYWRLNGGPLEEQPMNVLNFGNVQPPWMCS